MVVTRSSTLTLGGGLPLGYKGAIACAANPNYPAAVGGDIYIVSTAGKIGGASGPNVVAGDMIIAKAVTVAGDHATVGTNWDIIETNVDWSTVAITGGTINGTTIGATTPTTGDFTTINIERTGDKGINLATYVPDFGDVDDAAISMGTWNDEVDITGQTAHFVPVQVHLHSHGSTGAADIAAARLRVDTDGANTETAVQVLQIRSSIADNVASAGAFGAGMSIDSNMTVQTGELVCGGFSIAGTGKVTPAGTNPVTVLQAANWNTGGGTESVWYVIDAYQNAATNTVRALLRGNVIAGTATNGLEIANTSGTLTTGIRLTGTIGTDIVLQNGETITNSPDGTIVTSGILKNDSVDIGGGAIDGTTIGAASAAAATFTGVTVPTVVTTANATSFYTNIPVTGTDTTLHTSSHMIDGASYIYATATGDGAGDIGPLTIGIGVNGTADIIHIGDANALVDITDAHWSISEAGKGTFTDVETPKMEIIPTTTGTLLDYQLETEWTAGTLLYANFNSATTASAGINGVALDLQTNLTIANKDINGYWIKLPTQTNTGDDPYVTHGLYINGGAIVHNTGTGSSSWYGGKIEMPNITQTTGTVTSYGLYINGGTVTSGTEYSIFVDSGNTRFDGYNAFLMGGTPTSGVVLSVGANGTTMPAATTAWRDLQTGGNVTELAGAAITDICGAYFNTFTITDGGGAETVAQVSTVYIAGAPTAGTAPTAGPYALFVDAGTNRFDGLFNAGGTDLTANQIWGATAAGTAMEGKTVSAGAGITITHAANSITVTATGSGVAWSEIADAAFAIAVSNGYICNRGTLVTGTLPASMVQGGVFQIVGKGAGLFSIAQRANQMIHFGALTSTTGVGGSVTATAQYDCIELVCTVADLEWTVVSAVGNFTVV